jgi:hypothetical protein
MKGGDEDGNIKTRCEQGESAFEKQENFCDGQERGWFRFGPSEAQKEAALIRLIRTIEAVGIVISPQPCCSAISMFCERCGTITMHRWFFRITHPTDLQVINRGSWSGSIVCQLDEQPYESSHSHRTNSPMFAT